MSKLIPIWAGVECTVNRVGENYFHQCQKNGHDKRMEDLERFAALGIERIRYPFVWEIAAQKSMTDLDWSWADERTRELKRVGLTPIAGLIHHGSGPKGTSLVDPEFPEKFAAYAKSFAERYPWITDYTPVNEPLTTARFSGLYGVWYPHEKTDRAFIRALFNQVKGTILAMREIRHINPQARLIQTEDLGRAQGTAPVQYQVDFENHRRWLSFDMLCGKINPYHYLYGYLVSSGFTDEEMHWLADNACPPDILGINHYLLSNRFLDHRMELYPEGFHGGNGLDQYADVGAVDTTAAPLPRPESVLKEVWDRYQLPVAITEIHLLGTREDQMRWLMEVTTSAQKAKNEHGVDMRAVTAWSLLGSFDWNSLCTANRDYYESGVFDIRGPKPRPTALSKMVQSWSKGESFKHPVLLEPGWWNHRDRAPFGPRMKPKPIVRNPRANPILITGANGTLGRAFARICERRNLPYRALTRQDMEISRFQSVQKVIEQIQPWAVINTAGYVRVDEAESDRDRCFRENVEGPKNLAKMCTRKKIPLLHFSSDLVFDGNSKKPYMESDLISPLNVYGESKAESEKHVLELNPNSLVVRTSSFFGPWDQYNFVFSVLKAMSRGKTVQAASDITVSPTYVPDLVDICLDLLIDGEEGVVHLINQGHLTWAQLAGLTADMALQQKLVKDSKWSSEKILSMPSNQMNFIAKRPQFSAMHSERIRILPGYEEALQRYFRDLEFVLSETKEMGTEIQL